MGNCLNKFSTKSDDENEDSEDSETERQEPEVSSADDDRETSNLIGHPNSNDDDHQTTTLTIASSSQNNRRESSSRRQRAPRNIQTDRQNARHHPSSSPLVNSAYSSSLTSLSNASYFSSSSTGGVHRLSSGVHAANNPSMNNMYCCLSSSLSQSGLGGFSELSEEDQMRVLKRTTLIDQLPIGGYTQNKKNKECVICMIDFEENDTLKYLPCMHSFHQKCIDAWLLRTLICPSCMEPVDTGLFAAYA